MKYFSHRHRLHLLVALLYELVFFIIFHVMSKLVFLSFSFQMYLFNSVWFFLVLLLKVDLWLYNLVLNSVSDVPT